MIGGCVAADDRAFTDPDPQIVVGNLGDSSVDIQTARNAGATSCGVTYGLRPESLKDHPPDILVDSMPELAEKIGVRVPANVVSERGA